MLHVLSVLSALVIGVGCGGNGGIPIAPEPPSPPEEIDLGDLPIGSFTLVVPEGEAPFPDLEGRWTVIVESDGDFFSSHEDGGSAAGRVTVSGDTMTVTDVSGSLICPEPHRSGRYTWTETETTVTFGLVNDGCAGRRFVTLFGPWTKL